MRYARSIVLILVTAFAATALGGCCCPAKVCTTQRTPAVMSVDPCYWWDPGRSTQPPCYSDPLR
jgi:hypothetical protein